MAEGEGKPSGGFDPWILFILVILAAAFFQSGGSSSGIFSNSGVKFGSPSNEGTVEEELRSTSGYSGNFQPSPVPLPTPVPTPPSSGGAQGTTINNPTKDNISMQAYGSTQLGYAEEYVQISASYLNRGKTMITGLVLKNKNNESASVGADEFGNVIFLNPGERAIISTAESPRGFNFKLNKCSGYLAQSKNYSPSISGFCPHISDLQGARDMTDACDKYLNSLPYCTTPTINFSTGIDNKCSEFISSHASYPGCVADFKNDSDFDKKEWRIYFGLAREFWNNRHEDVKLFNQTGELIAQTSY